MAYQVTGNEYLSLPAIREENGAVEGITFYTCSSKACWRCMETTGYFALIWQWKA